MKARCLHSALTAMLALAFVLLPGTAAVAADKAMSRTPTGNIADRWVFWPKAGQEKEFEAAVKEHAAWRKKAGEPFTWSTYQPIVGTDLTYYVIRSDDHQWKDFDAEDAWGAKAKANDAYEQQVGVHVARAVHYFEETDAAHSHYAANKDDKYFTVYSRNLKGGSRGDVMGALDKIHKALMDEKWPYRHRIAWLIGGADTLRIVIPTKNYAEMADPDPPLTKVLAKGLGSDEAASATLKQFDSSFDHYDTTVYVLRPDLSTQK
jgi:hypothetical protein